MPSTPQKSAVEILEPTIKWVEVIKNSQKNATDNHIFHTNDNIIIKFCIYNCQFYEYYILINEHISDWGIVDTNNTELMYALTIAGEDQSNLKLIIISSGMEFIESNIILTSSFNFTISSNFNNFFVEYQNILTFLAAGTGILTLKPFLTRIFSKKIIQRKIKDYLMIPNVDPSIKDLIMDDILISDLTINHFLVDLKNIQHIDRDIEDIDDKEYISLLKSSHGNYKKEILDADY